MAEAVGVAIKSAYTVANAVLAMSFGLLTLLGIRSFVGNNAGSMSTLRLKTFYSFILGISILRSIYFIGSTIVFLSIRTAEDEPTTALALDTPIANDTAPFAAPVTPSSIPHSVTVLFYVLFWLPQLVTIIPFCSVVYWWTDIYTTSRNYLMFSDLSFRKRWTFGEIGVCFVLIVLQICVFIYSVTIPPAVDSGPNSFISIDGILLGLSELLVTGAVAALMIFFAVYLKVKQYYQVNTGMQLHVTLIIWLFSFLLQGILSLLAENLEHFRTVWYDVEHTTATQLIGDAIYALCEWLPLYFVLEERFRSRVQSYTFDLTDMAPDQDQERRKLLDGIAHKMRKVIPRSDLYIGEREKIGEGSFGVVYKGVYNGDDVAIKVIKYTEYDVMFVEEFCKEVETLSTLAHPNIVRFIGVCIERPDISMITEFMPNGSLRKILDNRAKHAEINYDLIVKMLVDIANAMKYLHCMHIIHRDLKCDNLLVGSNWAIKVTDFGLAKLIQMTEEKNTRMTRNVGTVQWVAPEIMSSTTGNYTEKVDVYSFGTVIWELITKDVPFRGMTNEEIVGLVARNQHPPIPPDTPEFFRNLLARCWETNPTRRPSFDQILVYLAQYKASSSLFGHETDSYTDF